MINESNHKAARIILVVLGQHSILVKFNKKEVYMHKAIIVLLLTSLFCATGRSEGIDIKNLMINHPEWYIKITDWHVYAGWSCPAIIHHVTIENTSDIAY